MRKAWFCFAVMLILVAACRDGRKHADQAKPALMEISDMTADAHRWADSVCKTMTLRQKVAQLFMPAVFARNDFWTIRQIKEYADSCIGGIILLKGDVPGAVSLIDSLQSSLSVPAFIAIDAEWGLAMRLADTPEFPANNAIHPGADDQLLYDYGNEVARECRHLGINMVLGPVVDVSAPNSFMRRRSFGEDPERVADLALAYARGLEDGDVISVAKHFPGHGSVSVDSHKKKGVIDRSLNEMDSIDLYPFRKWVEQRLSGIMVGHLAVPSIDPQMKPAAVSSVVMKDLLRDDLGFTGLVLTDAINMKGVEGYGSTDAIMAGADIVVAPVKTNEEIEAVLSAVREGRISEADIDTHVKRVLFYKYLIGLDTPAHLHRSDTTGVSSPHADSISHRLSGR